MERFQKKLSGEPSAFLESILHDKDKLILVVLLFVLLNQGADIILVLALAYIFLF